MPKHDKHCPDSAAAQLKRLKRQLWLTAAILLVLLLLAACSSAAPSRGELGANQEILKSCDTAHPPASLAEIDGSGSSASDAITTERMAAIESIVRRTTICSGRLRVIVFSASSAATSTLFDGFLKQEGATDNSRLKKVPDAINAVMDKIRTGYAAAVKTLPQTGSDIHAQYRHAAEWMAQLGGGYRLDLHVFTDGFQNIGVDLAAQPLTKAEAEALANQAAVPQLPGASIIVAGLGRVAGTPPSSAIVEGLVAYYNAVCAKTAATTCLSVTDYTTAGR